MLSLRYCSGHRHWADRVVLLQGAMPTAQNLVVLLNLDEKVGFPNQRWNSTLYFQQDDFSTAPLRVFLDGRRLHPLPCNPVSPSSFKLEAHAMCPRAAEPLPWSFV